MPKQPSAIPVGTQFSPELINLHAFLQEVIPLSGNKAQMESAVWQPHVRTRSPKKAPTKRQRSLPLEAAVQYGLLTEDSYKATDVARRLASLASKDDLAREFARHILVDLGCIRVVEAAQQMKLDNRKVTGDTLARYLTDQGYNVTEHNTAINSLRMWLARAGLFSKNGWDVDSQVKRDLVGLDDDDIANVVGLTVDQNAFLLALCRINPPPKHPASDIRSLAESIVGHSMARASQPKTLLEPLKAAGLIDYTTGGTSSGKSARITTTPKFQADVLERFIEHAARHLDSALTAYYKQAPADIYRDLSSANTGTKGKALEAYAVHIMRLMGLRFIAWRKRARDTTGQSEVDAVLAGIVGGLPTRWQVQCKNTPAGRVDLETVAREVGLASITRATHILVLANCGFTQDAETYANEVMRHNPVAIFLLGRKDFEAIKQMPGSLPTILRDKSAEMMHLLSGSLFSPMTS